MCERTEEDRDKSGEVYFWRRFECWIYRTWILAITMGCSWLRSGTLQLRRDTKLGDGDWSRDWSS